MALTSGTDVSHHQEPNINWQQVYQSGQRFAFIRASFVGTESKKPNPDRNFEKHWAAARAVNGLLLGAYHYFVPVADINEQIDYFLNIVALRKLDLPLALDFEHNGGLDKQSVSRAVEAGLKRLADKVGYRPIIYTGPSFWNGNTVSSPVWGQHDLWIANYGKTTPTLPRDWTNWRFWQWTEAGSISGMPTTVDVDWFNGDEAQLRQYAASSMGSGGSLPQANYRIQATTSINVRSGPSTDQAVVGSLKANEQATVLDLAGSDVWSQIGPNRWAAFATGGQQLCIFRVGAPSQIIVAVGQINIRSGPSTTTADVGDLTKNMVLSVSDLSGNDAWVKIGEGRWAAFAKNGQRFMKWLG